MRDKKFWFKTIVKKHVFKSQFLWLNFLVKCYKENLAKRIAFIEQEIIDKHYLWKVFPNGMWL